MKKLVMDDGSLTLEQALIIALLVLVAAATLYVLGTAIAAKFTAAESVTNAVPVPSIP